MAQLKPRTVFSFTQERAQSLQQKRGAVGGNALKKVVNEALRLPERTGIPDYRVLRESNARRYPKKYSATYAVETERNVFALVYRLDKEILVSRPPRGAKRALLYVSHLSADAAGR